MEIKISESPQDLNINTKQNININKPPKGPGQNKNPEDQHQSDSKQNISIQNNSQINQDKIPNNSSNYFLQPQQGNKKSSKSSMIQSPNASPLKLQNKKTSQGDFTKKSTFLCRFCGGKKCKKEDYKKNPHENALKGVHSDWINNRIIASQRLSKRIMDENDVIGQLKENNIKAIFNLQEPGEHPYCGDGLIKETGFTYDPEDIMKNDIYFFNFNWVDMTVTDEKMIMRLMDLMDFIINQLHANFLVHCHAGTGRTGLAIASWLIYGQDYSAEQAIKQFQQRRKGGLQKSKQRTFLKKFETFITENKKSFKLQKPLSIEEIVLRQKKAHLQRHSKNSYKVPILVEYILNNINKRHEKKQDTYQTILNGFVNPGNRQVFTTPWDYYMNKEVEKLKGFIDEGKFDYLQSYETRVLCQVLLDFFESLFMPTIDFMNINKMNILIEKYNGEITKLFTDKEIINCLSLYEFSLLSKIIDFVLQILNSSKNLFQNSHEDSKNFENLRKKFFLRMVFALYKIKNELSDQCFNNTRDFDFSTYENFNQMNNSREDPHKQQKTQINQFQMILDMWSFSVAQENSNLNQQEVKNCYFKAYNLFLQQEQLQKKNKNKKNNQVFNNLLDNDIKSLILNTRVKKEENPKLRQVHSEMNNVQINQNLLLGDKSQSQPNKIQSSRSLKSLKVQEVLKEDENENEEEIKQEEKKNQEQIQKVQESPEKQKTSESNQIKQQSQINDIQNTEDLQQKIYEINQDQQQQKQQLEQQENQEQIKLVQNDQQKDEKKESFENEV